MCIRRHKYEAGQAVMGKKTGANSKFGLDPAVALDATYKHISSLILLKTGTS